jgi:hypothetical protein
MSFVSVSIFFTCIVTLNPQVYIEIHSINFTCEKTVGKMCEDTT